MAEVSYDSQSFSIDGRRLWLVSGSVSYVETPRGLWADRLRAAKQAGLNCIATDVVWSAHEHHAGEFDFEGELDLRAFVQAASDHGLYCVLRTGPFVGGNRSFGGLPAYLQGLGGGKLGPIRFRENDQRYMEAVDRYFRALFEQVADLQASAPDGGPIVVMQSEQAWLCANPDQGTAYLERLVSMMRQHGCAVPIVNTNNLWQHVEGTIDTWNGSGDMPAMMRQLAIVQPQAPPMAMQLTLNGSDAWGGVPEPQQPGGQELAYRLAGMLGVGGQFNLSPFAADSAPGLTAGRGHAGSAVLNKTGQRGELYHAAKRICTFASHFANVLANCDSPPAPIPALGGKHPTALLHRSGSQGEIVMLLKSAGDKSTHTPLMLPNGLQLDVPHKGQRAAWVLANASLAGNATLDYTSLSPWALIDRKLLVVFGPAGAEGVISVDGQHHAVTVPTNKTPTVIEGDPVHIAVLSHDQIDAACITTAGLVIGCDGTDDQDNPRPLAGWGTQFTITPDGELSRKRITQPTRPTTPRLGKWQTLSLKPLIDGTDDAYQTIDQPADMGALGQPFGYGWYRLDTAKPVNDQLHLAHGGDRLHLYSDGKLVSLIGRGEGAEQAPFKAKLAGTVVALADDTGRAGAGQHINDDLKGLAGELYLVKPIKPGKAQRIKQPAGDPFAVVGYAHHQRASVRPMSEAIQWTVKPNPRKPIIMELHTGAGRGGPSVVSINDEQIYFDAADLHNAGVTRLLLDPAGDGPMTGGKNSIKLEMLKPLPDATDPDKLVRFYQTTAQVTPKKDIAFAPWTVPTPDDEDWRDVPKSLPSQPAWLMAQFGVKSLDAPLLLEPTGLSKGVAVLNGHTLGRYWHQTREGAHVHTHQRLYLPEPWLRTDAPNHLLLFDEHGRTPGKCRLVYD